MIRDVRKNHQERVSILLLLRIVKIGNFFCVGYLLMMSGFKNKKGYCPLFSNTLSQFQPQTLFGLQYNFFVNQERYESRSNL